MGETNIEWAHYTVNAWEGFLLARKTLDACWTGENGMRCRGDNLGTVSCIV